MASRTPEEIRASIESNRAELGRSVGRLRGEIDRVREDVEQRVERITDWRGHLIRHRKQVLIGAAVTGFLLGGGVAAIGLLRRRRR
jgi:hypothetical protein